MNTIYEKNIIRKPNKRMDVVEDRSKEIKEYSSIQGCEDFLWYLMESAIPEQVPYCSDCISMGKKSIIKDGYCSYHKQTKAKYAFKTLNRHQRQTNIDFATGASWLIASLCDASARRIDHKKIIKGIIRINENNPILSFKNLCDSFSPKKK